MHRHERCAIETCGADATNLDKQIRERCECQLHLHGDDGLDVRDGDRRGALSDSPATRRRSAGNIPVAGREILVRVQGTDDVDTGATSSTSTSASSSTRTRATRWTSTRRLSGRQR